MGKNKSTYDIAVGLEYNRHEDEAPIIGVKGQKLRADEILKIANKYNIPIVEDPELAVALNAVEIDQKIPEDLFKAVAIILHSIDNKPL